MSDIFNFNEFMTLNMDYPPTANCHTGAVVGVVVGVIILIGIIVAVKYREKSEIISFPVMWMISDGKSTASNSLLKYNLFHQNSKEK